jgi:molecular chaperone GrpE
MGADHRDGAGADGAPASARDDTDGRGDAEGRIVGDTVDSDVVDGDVVDGEVVEESGAEAEVAEAVELDPLAAAQAERDEYLDALRRLQAEFENYRKRVAKQQADQVARASLSLVEQLLPVLDALDLATDHIADPDSGDAKALVASAGLLQGVLGRAGLEKIAPAGEAFDPTAHEAVGQAADDDGQAADGPVVAEVMRAGYRFNGAVVRPAMVTVRG